MRWRGGDNVRVISEEIPFRLMSSKTWVELHMANITEQEVDLLITGREINGIGIARDAIGRGLSVVFAALFESTSVRIRELTVCMEHF
jgi:hypothetical protein